MQACRLAALSAIVLYACAASGPAVRDLDGRSVQPLDGDLVVMIFTRTDCPVANRYAPEVTRLHERFKQARFWLVYVDRLQSEAIVRTHVREYGYRMPALLDRRHELVRVSGATITPEAAVYVRGVLTYRGRIDNRYIAPGKSRPVPSMRDLEGVLEAVTTRKQVAFRSTNAVGCFIGDLR